MSGIFRITDGQTSVDFWLTSDQWAHLQTWTPKQAARKSGGQWADTLALDGRMPIDAVRENAVEELNFQIARPSPDELVKLIRLIKRLGEKSYNYFARNWGALYRVASTGYAEYERPVWLEVRAPQETNTRYAILVQLEIENEPRWFEQPANACPSVSDTLTATIERRHWQAVRPMTARAVEITGADNDGVGLTDDTGIIYISSKHLAHNLTHIFTYDDSTLLFSANLIGAALPITLFPLFMAVNDCVYFISNENPFSCIIFDLIAGSGMTYVWEYWDGAAWTTLTVRSDYTFNTGSGIIGVFWRHPSDWERTTVNAIANAWAVRARLTVVGGGATNPSQQNRDMFSVVWGAVEIAPQEISGDIDAILRVDVTAEADKDSFGGGIPDLWANRIIIASRSLERDDPTSNAYQFSAYLENDVNWFNITGTTTTTIDPLSPTGVAATRTHNAVDDMSDSVFWILESTIAPAYHGRFRIFLRAQMVSGALDQVGVRVQVRISGGFTIYTSPTKYIPVLGAVNMLDFGTVQIPGVDIDAFHGMRDLDTPYPLNEEQIIVAVQTASNDAAAAVIHIYDVILMPCDEMFIDVQDVVVDDSSTLDNLKALAIDSATYLRGDIRAVVHALTGGANGGPIVSGRWIPVGLAPITIRPMVAQRLWLLAARRYEIAYDEADWRSAPEFTSKIKLHVVERYLGARGNE